MKLSSKDYAAAQDVADELAGFRDEFYIQPESIYLDGNSLGLLSKRAEASLLDLLGSWKQLGIDGWTEGKNPWYYMAGRLGEKMAPLVGAEPEEVMVTGSTTANLHQMLATFYRPEGSRTKILADELNFPSDLYAIKSQIKLRGLDPQEHLVSVKSRDGHTLSEDDIITAMTGEVAVAVLPGVLYRSGQILDMERLTAAAHERGILIGFDLCHSIGSVPHALHDWNTDFAFWCTYKHLNGGPGSSGGLFVNRRLFGTEPGLAGWFGSDKEKQFDMDHVMTPAGDAAAYQVGTPNILSAAPVIGSLELFEEAGIGRIREKSLRLTDYLIGLVGELLTGYGFSIASPAGHAQRGGHVYLEHDEAARICRALKEEGVIPDFRAPKGIRLAPVALYNSFEEVRRAMLILRDIMKEERYTKFENRRGIIA
ncbi:kynureninase [Edaphobacillus lindanitolerans]|uniref:Kynureninase n=1 Tax=Edaphobacillus lindanitolerans TaxID=550447 RepID=A0A1U7PQT3_9BACI|nr:kynureninase [Edaphobacillus lindanitolerans]SIT84436.1 Kynureninase [Edaphobacillus lindanitolerans]